MLDPSSANRRALRRSSSRFITAWRMTKLIRDRPSSSWLRWMRTSRSTWPRPARSSLCDEIDEVADLDRVAGEKRDLLEVDTAAGVLA